MIKRRFLTLVLLSLLLAGSAPRVLAQAVAVTLQLDANPIPVNGTTTLRVYAQVVPALRPVSDQIVTWYVDVLNLTGTVARAEYNAMQKPASGA